MIGCVYAVLKYSLEIVVDRSFVVVALVLLAFFLKKTEEKYCVRREKNCLSTTKIQPGREKKARMKRVRHHAIHVWFQKCAAHKIVAVASFSVKFEQSK